MTIPRTLTTALACLGCCAAMAAAFWMGQRSSPDPLPQLMAATSASGTNMAVATGAVSDDAEGVFFLDYTTGDLQCLVYYPRARGFGARFVGNVAAHLGGGGKDAQYLMVVGSADVKGTTGNKRPANSIIYVTNVTTGMFAAYAIPWDRTAESAGRAQTGTMVYVGGGPIRNFQIGGGNAPAAVVDPNP